MNRQAIKDEKRNKLLDACFKLFVKKGVQETSIQDITNEAGLGKGTFYSYFKDKYEARDILIAFKSRSLYGKAVEKLSEEKNIKFLSDKVIFIINNLINELNRKPYVLKFISKDLSYGLYKSTLKEIYHENRKSIYDLFAEGIKQNGEKLKNPNILISIIVELVSSTCYNSILYNQPLPINEFKQYLFNSVKAIIEDPNS